MTFGIYTGEIAGNASVNLTRHGTFEARTVGEAVARIELNVKYRYCDSFDSPLFDRNLNATLRSFGGTFVCLGDPLVRNVVWRDRKAVVSFFDACKGERARGRVA